MNKEVISDKQGICLLAMHVVGTTTLLVLGSDAKQHYWLAILVSLIFSLMIAAIFGRLYNLFPGKNLFDIAELCLGKFGGSFIIIILTLYCFDEGTEVIINWAQFLRTVTLPDTPTLSVTIIMMALCIWIVKHGIEVIGRWVETMIIIYLVIIGTSLLLLIPHMNIEHLEPFFKNIDIKSVFKGAFNVFAFPFGEMFAFSIAYSEFETPKSSYKIFIKGTLLSALIIFIISTANVLVLGVKISSQYYYPTYFSLTRINLGRMLQRLEITTTFIYTLGTFVKISIYLLAMSKGISNLFKLKDYRTVVIPMGLLVINFSGIFLKTPMLMWEYAYTVWVYYAIFFEAVLPIIIFIVAEIRNKYLKSSS